MFEKSIFFLTFKLLTANIQFMKIIISGSTGFLGRSLSAYFEKAGNEVVALARQDFKLKPAVLASRLDGAAYVIHLAGAPIIKRWTNAYRREIYDSRILTTRLLVDAIACMENPPPNFICASATGIYPEAGEHCESTTQVADNFLGKVCHDWEAEAIRAQAHCRRVLLFRFGIILGREGGALQQMAAPFKMGVGGRIGDGSQMMSWIHLDDVINIFRFATDHMKLNGAVNICAPNPVSNKAFTRMLAAVLRKPALFTVPALALRMVYGGGAVALTSGQNVMPCKLIDNGYDFLFPDLEGALKDLLPDR